MDDKFIKSFLANVVLTRYMELLDIGDINWVDSGKVNQDSMAYYFKSGGVEYVLVYEDYPGDADFGDGLSHDLVMINGFKSLELKFSDGKKIDGITGWYTLFKEKSR